MLAVPAADPPRFSSAEFAANPGLGIHMIEMWPEEVWEPLFMISDDI